MKTILFGLVGFAGFLNWITGAGWRPCLAAVAFVGAMIAAAILVVDFLERKG